MAERFNGFVEVTPAAAPETVVIARDGDSATVVAGGSGVDGGLFARNAAGEEAVTLLARLALLALGSPRAGGIITLRATGGSTTVRVDGDLARILLGGGGKDGKLSMSNRAGQETVTVFGSTAQINLGGGGADGRIFVQNATGANTVHVIGDDGRLVLGGGGADGDIYVRSPTGTDRMHLDGASAQIDLGGNGADGKVFVQNAAGANTIHVIGEDGRLVLGGGGADGDIYVRTATGADTIHLDGASGDIAFLNADCAEDFTVDDTGQASPGTVMVLGAQGRLRPSAQGYDRAVVGVVSGAGGLKPGIVLDRQSREADRLPIALVGKAYCKVDADYRTIAIGDLLTTSPTPGHAMAVEPSVNPLGAVIGKAMAPLGQGQGLIPMLIGLQ
jgi:hypothetical protein